MLTFAVKTLLADRRKLMIAMVGVVFSLVLMNVQGGMFIGLIQKSALLVDKTDADIWIGHRGVQNADITADIPVAWLDRVRSVPGVQMAEPYIVAGGMMELHDGNFEGVLIVGTDPNSMLGGAWSFAEGDARALRSPNAITIERLDDDRLGNPGIGDMVEISHRKARIVAKTDGIVGFITTPYVFTSLDSARIYGNVQHGRCSYGLVTVDPEADMPTVVSEIQRRLPDADVYDAKSFSWKTKMYWILRTGLGMSFGGSTLLGLAVGLVMVAQSLYAFVIDHLEQFAALKAIGGTDSQIARILMFQGASIALMGGLLGNAISLVICYFYSSPQLTITMTPQLMVLATVLASLICLVSAYLPFRRVKGVDPVIVLRG